MNLAKGAVQVLGSLAPTVATMLGGPFAGMAVQKLEEAFGGGATDAAARQSNVEQALLSGNPDALVKVKQIEADVTTKMAELGLQRDQLTYQDTASARAMETATKDATPRELSWVVVGGFIILALAVIVACIAWPERVKEISAAAWTLITTLLTFLAAEAKQACTFWFGSSSDSQAKTATLSEIAKS